MKKKGKGRAGTKDLKVKKAVAKRVKGGTLTPSQAAALAARRPTTKPGGTSDTGGTPTPGFIPGLNPVVT
jgi:hypothetical protein